MLVMHLGSNVVFVWRRSLPWGCRVTERELRLSHESVNLPCYWSIVEICKEFLTRILYELHCCTDYLFSPELKYYCCPYFKRITLLNHSMKVVGLGMFVGCFDKNILSLFTIIQIAWSNQIFDPLHPLFLFGLQKHLMYGLCTFQSSDN